MNILKTAVQELWGLFVEDGSYAVAIAVWLLFCAALLPHFGAANWRAPLLLVGLLLILLENVARSAKRA